jgi:hypothetical protein
MERKGQRADDCGGLAPTEKHFLHDPGPREVFVLEQFDELCN